MSVGTAALVGLIIIAVVYLWYKIGMGGTVALAVIIVPLAIVFMLVHSFQAFTSTTLVAEVQATPVTNMPHTMAVHFVQYNYDGSVKSTSEYELQGDRWELLGDVVSFEPWVNVIGVSNGFSLSRITSQYDDSNGHAVRPVDLSGNGTPQFSIPFIERSHYKGGVLEPADGVTYRIFVTLQGQMYASHA